MPQPNEETSLGSLKAQDHRHKAIAYYEFGQWIEKREWEGAAQLVEIWRDPTRQRIRTHPSRNAFYWVDDPAQRSLWHSLALDSDARLFSMSGWQARRNRPPHVTLYRNSAPKLGGEPVWATVDNLIGYTFVQPVFGLVQDDPLTSFLLTGAQNLPTIYYKHGHVTLDHATKGNIGWVDKSGFECLFFGNIPKG